MPAYYLSASINRNHLTPAASRAGLSAVSKTWLFLTFLLLHLSAVAADDDLGSGLNSSLQSPLSNPLSNSKQLLPAEEAFLLTVSQGEGKEVRLHWLIKEGYYLYRDSISINAKEASVQTPDFPQSETIEDEYFGEVEIYKTSLTLDINAVQVEKNLTVTIHYQGCAEDLYCYPMQMLTISLSFASTRP